MQAVQQLGEGVEIKEDDLHATFMQAVQQLGEGVEIEEIGNPTTEVIASKHSRFWIKTFNPVKKSFGGTKEGTTSD
ncbi:hypothetical protein R3W88_014065 [Solanum pinnatisectum]|uniref:Uncharacterized protein n=1 Tax=Solanum pinnatisectum TaxID=50273 RepID=A0AAV9KRP7_9SOLN|nr:hypothetical protein R3W88_014065 [Solanum pinnatisectum]